MARFAAPPATAGHFRREPVRWAAGLTAASAPTWPGRAKGRQPAPDARRRPGCGQPAPGRACADLRQLDASSGAPACLHGQAPARRALRALEDVKKVLTGPSRNKRQQALVGLDTSRNKRRQARQMRLKAGQLCQPDPVDASGAERSRAQLPGHREE